jgi:hypothetical protein
MVEKEHEFEALCGKIIGVVTDRPETYDTPESLCLLCPKDSCAIYTDYLYESTHYNNPI